MRNPIKKVYSVVFLAAMLITLSVPAFASERIADVGTVGRIDLPDGYYILVETFVTPDAAGEDVMRGEVQTIYGHKNYTYYSSGTAVWRATLNGTFTYDGSSSSCTEASLSFTAYDSTYYKASGNAYPSGSSAVADFTVGYRVLGITVSTSAYHMTLTCDASGNLS